MKMLNVAGFTVCAVAVLVITVVMSCLFARAAGYRYTITGSLPEGVYHISPAHRPLRRFDLVVFCLPHAVVRLAGSIDTAGPCADTRREPFLKVVIGVAGDRVRLEGDAVWVNGVPLHGCGIRYARAPRFAWRAGIIPPGEVFVCGLSDTSWDSRYFGPVMAMNTYIATPVWTRSWGWKRLHTWEATDE